MNAGLVNRITYEIKVLIKERKQGLTLIPYDVIYHDYLLTFSSKFMRFCFLFFTFKQKQKSNESSGKCKRNIQANFFTRTL